MRAVAAIPAVGLLAGSAIGLWGPSLPAPFIAVALAGTACLALPAVMRGWPVVLPAAVALGFAVGGAALANRAWMEAWQPSLKTRFAALAEDERRRAEAEHRVVPEDVSVPVVLEGVLRADAAPSPTGTSLSLDVTGMRPAGGASPEPVSGGALVTVGGSLSADFAGGWRAGRRVRLPADVHRPARYLNPGVPDEERAMARRGSVLVGTAKSGALVDVLARGTRLDEFLGAVRGYSRHALADAVGRWSALSAAIVSAIVIGDRAGLDPDVQRQLQEAGTYHVIAISGGNIAILTGLLLSAFRVAGMLGCTGIGAVIVVLLLYAQLVGGGASVDRATLMAVVFLAGRAIDHRGSALNMLAVVAGLIVVWSPMAVADPSFVLTFGATLAILVVSPLVTWRPRVVVSMLAASMATEALLMPVGALVFSRVTVAGLALNFLAIPLMAVAQIAGMVVVPLALVSSRLASAAGWVAHVGAAGLVWSAALVRFAPRTAWRVAAPSHTTTAGYYVCLAVAWVLWRHRRTVSGTSETSFAALARRAATVGAVGLAVWIALEPGAWLRGHGDGRIHVVFIDVGQGDATFARFPDGRSMLVDAGGLTGRFDIGDRVVAPVLRLEGLQRLDVLVLTHGDPDHIGGATAIVREFRPIEVWEGVPVPPFEPLAQLRRDAAAAGSRWLEVRAGDGRVFGGVRVTVRHPPDPEWERQRVRNDDSVVVDLAMGSVSVVLTGDIGVEGERAVAPTLPPARVRLLKVPHHGSMTSSSPSFLRRAAASVAVVSVGRANHFGHPSPLVLDRYRAAHVDLFRTDRDGAVRMTTDGVSTQVCGWTGRCWQGP